MNGLKRLIFAGAARLFNLVAWLPLAIAALLMGAAGWCEGRARAQRRPAPRRGAPSC